MKMLSLRSRLVLLLALLATPVQALVLQTTPDFPSAITPRGPKGDMGCSVIPTNGAPAASLGRDCDFAFDVGAGKVYGPKIAGQWGVGVVMSPVAAAQVFADRARFDREQARASAAAAADSASAAAASAAAAADSATGVATNSILAASPTSRYPHGVWRADVSTGFGAPPLFFVPQAGSCASNGLWNDMGYCVDASGGSFKAVHPSGKFDVRQFGANNAGAVDASGAVNAAIRAASSAGGSVLFPCGTYFFAAAGAALPSNVEVAGANKACVQIKPSPTLAANPQTINRAGAGGTIPTVFSNADWIAGNSNIVIHDLTIDTSGGVAGNPHLISFNKLTGGAVYNVLIKGNASQNSGMGVTGTKTSSLTVRQVSVDGIANGASAGTESACFNFWDSSKLLTLTENFCDGKDVASYGIQINGISADYAAGGTSEDIVVSKNIIKNVARLGIDITGLWNQSTTSPAYGTAKTIIVSDNVIDGVTQYHGIRASDGYGLIIKGNQIKNVPAGNGIYLASDRTAPTYGCIISDNVLESVGNSAVDAITVGHPGGDDVSGCTLSGNTILGSTYRYAVVFQIGAHGNLFYAGGMDPGLSGTVADLTGHNTLFGLESSSTYSARTLFPQKVMTNETSDTNGPLVVLRKRRGGGATQSNDFLGSVVWQAYDGSTWVTSAQLAVAPDSVAPGAAPGHLFVQIAGQNSLVLYKDKLLAGATTQSTSPFSGALVSNGGLGVAKDAFLGGLLRVSGQTDLLGRLKFSDMGQCTMTGGACPTQSLTSTYAYPPLCMLTWAGSGTLAGVLKAPSTTTTVTPASSNASDTAVVNWACFGG